ncbi:60S ribosomal protein L12 [Vulpes lagopus]
MVGDDITKGNSDWEGVRITVKLTIQNRQAQSHVVPSAPNYQSPQGTTKREKQENIKHNGNTTFDEITNIAQHMQH